MSDTSKRSWHELMALRTGEWRFLQNSLKDFATVDQVVNVNSDLPQTGNRLHPHYEFGVDGAPTPAQSVICGLPCMEVEELRQGFLFFNPVFPLCFADRSAFTIEYLGFPRRRVDSCTEVVHGVGSGALEIMDLVGQGATRHLSLGYDPATGLAYVCMNMNGAGDSWSYDGVWWRPDHPLHLVFTRSLPNAQDQVIARAYVNGELVEFAANDIGWSGLTANGYLFNNFLGQDLWRPFCGGHLLVRCWSSVAAGNTAMVSHYEVTRMFQRAQRHISTLMFPVPEYLGAPT